MDRVIATSDFELPRDRWGRPKINGEVYTRASSLSIADKSNLIAWKAKMVAEGARRRPDLLTQDADISYLAEKLSEVGGGSDGADAGTEIHNQVSAFYLTGEQPTDLSAQAAIALIDSHFDVVASELTVVSEQWKVAGTLDLLLLSRTTGMAFIGDLKSSGSDVATSVKYQGVSWCGQMTAYSRSTPILKDLTLVPWEEMGLPVPSQDRGVVIHLHRDSAVATFVDVTLDESLVNLALGVIEARRGKYAQPV